MKYIKQICVILLFSALGELLHFWIPLPIPASIYGLVLLLLALCFHIVRLEWVKETGDFLVQILTLLFIPATVGLMTSVETVKAMLLPILVSIIVLTTLVLLISGRVTQWVIRRAKGDGEDGQA
ncbi:MAG: CidA/LrgA family protein [Oscillospiraceae bacterium]|jgi:holin-like protein